MERKTILESWKAVAVSALHHRQWDKLKEVKLNNESKVKA